MVAHSTTEQLIQAALIGDTNEVKRLIPFSNPLDHRFPLALCHAAQNGHADCVKLLIPVSDPKAMDSTPLRLAVIQGDIECVKLLLPVSDPKAMKSGALRVATYYGHTKCVDLLFSVSDPQVALVHLQKDLPNAPEKWQYLADKIAAIQQKDVLNNEVDALDNKVKMKILSKI